MTNFNIQPLVGFGDLKFGQTLKDTIAILGEAEEIDEIEGDDNMNTVILHYWKNEMSIFFEGIEKSVISCFETDNQQATLFGVKVFDLDRKSLVRHMHNHGFTEHELEKEEGENRVTFEEGLIDFFFHGDELLAVSWGVLVNANGDIEQI